MSSKLAAAPVGPRLWHLFVGRANKEPEESDIKEYLESRVITDSDVRKLEQTYPGVARAPSVYLCLSCAKTTL